MHFTPFEVTTIWSFTVVPMLPPVSAAKSTVMEPGCAKIKPGREDVSKNEKNKHARPQM